jgi:digeranylgeranylglycerophospholipid reductase
LSPQVVGSQWNKIILRTSTTQHEWTDPKYNGIVLDFSKLRSFLADQVRAAGSDVCLNQSYHHHEAKGDRTLVYLKDAASGEIKTIGTHVLVDATGAERKVLQQGKLDKTRTMAATGIEYLVEVSSDQYQRYAKTLSFFLGLKWMPQGYSWIFPMEENRLKIGVVRYFAHENIVPHDASYRVYLDHMLEECLDHQKFSILDTHGKTLQYTLGQKESKHEGNIIAIGDAISTLNPMASEGIRHAMHSGKISAKYILKYLQGDHSSFYNYSKDMRRYFGLRWKTSEFIMNCMYKEDNDQRLENYAKAFQKLSFKEMLEFSFEYKFRIILKFFWNFLSLVKKPL